MTTATHPNQLRAAIVAATPYMAAGVCIGAAVLEIVGAYLDNAPSRKKRQRQEGEPQGFAEFYVAFPRHEARRDAAAAYLAAITRASAEVILTGAKRYAEKCRGEDPKFTKLPATWLRADCWSDAPNLRVVGGMAFEETSIDGWLKRLEVWAGRTEQPKGSWRASWGPKPKEPGCKVPEAAKAQYLTLYPPRPKQTG